MPRGPAGTAGSAQRRGGMSLPRLIGAVAVVALHVAVIYALVTGLAQRTIEIVRPPIETRILPPEQPPPPLAPPPPPKLAPPPPLFVPPPDVRIAPPPPARSNAVTVVTPVKPAEPAPQPVAPPVVATPAPAPRAPVRVQPQLDPARACDPDYPPMSRRLGEQGSLMVQVQVDPDGRASDIKLIESSGFSRLDQAAMAGIRSSCRFLPGTVDGKPLTQWFTFRFVWKIK